MAKTTEFKKALQAHARGDIDTAWNYYVAARAAGEQAPIFFQNFGALARQREDFTLAHDLFSEGLKRYPNNAGILANRVNLIKDEQPVRAIGDLLVALDADPSLIESWLTLLFLLHEQGCFAWALQLVQEALKAHPRDGRLWYRVLAIMSAMGDDEDEALNHQENKIISVIDELMDELPEEKRSEFKVVMAGYGQSRNRSDIASKYYHELKQELLTKAPTTAKEKEEKEKLFHMSSWNYSNYLLTRQDFARGWKLYEHGLCTPCENKNGQQWQRALYKPYDSDELPVWRGEALQGKHLLVLAEQGIGDTISFLSLLPTLEAEGARLTVLTSDRLATSFTKFSKLSARFIKPSEIKKESISASEFDYQTAAGSICQHRFQHPSEFAPQTPVLTVPEERLKAFREKYGIIESGNRLIGVSWRGGASKNRKREKSIEIEQLIQLLQPRNGITYLSLQYGDVSETVHQLKQNGIQLHSDPDIDAIHGFPTWLEQTAACDGILSVANTTIHASGSLGIPTLCLLGRNSDWRWLSDPGVTRSYWYQSVGIARQAVNGSWETAIQEARRWLDNGCPWPQGKAWVDSDVIQ